MPSVVITGAARGLGYAFLQYFAARPEWTVFGLVRRDKPATDAKLAAEGIKTVTIIEADITDAQAQLSAAAAVSKATGGKLDLLINNAAALGDENRWKAIHEFSPALLEEDFSRTFRTNVLGVAYTTNAFLPLIRAGSAKKVITLATGMADTNIVNSVGIDNGTSYSVSKAATNMLVAKYNAQLGKSEGILFLALSPGFVDTDIASKLTTEEDMKGLQAMGAKFAEYAPDFKGPITPEESVRMMMEVVDRGTVETMGGGFLSHHGDKNWL